MLNFCKQIKRGTLCTASWSTIVDPEVLHRLQEQLADSMAGPEKLAQLQDSETQDTEKFKERTPHVRFSTPAPMETTRQPKSPMASRSSNAGITASCPQLSSLCLCFTSSAFKHLPFSAAIFDRKVVIDCLHQSECVIHCAGSTPFHSSGSRQRMSDFSDDSDDAGISESGSPTTVSRRLLEPVLLETIRNMNACKPSVNKASTLTCFYTLQ